MLSEEITAGLNAEERLLLQSYVPLYTLSEAHFSELLDAIRVENAYPGQILFKQGDTQHENVYLVDGQLELIQDGRLMDKVGAGSSAARFPIADVLPRKCTARADTRVRFVRIDSRQLSDVLERAHVDDYQVNDLDESGEDDWMTQLLHSPVMRQIPAANIQRVMMCVDQVAVLAGSSVIQQGEPGDYYYMLSKGHAVVSRDNNDGKPVVELARLGPGATFGEEALLSDSPRNSTITMLSNGVLLRLSKEDFIELIHHPLSASVGLKEARALNSEGALWLDVRADEEYQQQHLPESRNVPLESLRFEVGLLDPDQHYVVVAESRAKAELAAFVLTDKGLTASVLEETYSTPDSKLLPLSTDGESGFVASDELDSEVSGEIRYDPAQVVELQDKLQEMEAARDAAESESHQVLCNLKETIASASQRMRKLESERDAIKQEFDELGRRYREGELEREGMRQELASLGDREQVLQRRLRKTESHGVEERDRAESAAQQLEDLASKLTKAEELRRCERDNSDRTLGELKEQITELRLNFDEACNDLEEANAELSELKAQHAAGDSQLVAQVSELQALSKEQTDRANRLEKQLAVELAELSNVQAEAASSRDEIINLVTRLSASEQQSQQLLDAQQLKDEQHAQLLDEVNKTRSEQDTASSELQEVVTRLKTSEQAVQTLQDERERLVTEATSEQDARTQLQSALDELQSNYQQLQNELQQQQAHEDNSLESLRAQFEAECHAHALACDALVRRDASLASSHDQIKQLNTRLESLQQQVRSAEQLQGELDAALAQTGELRNELEAVRREVDEQAQQAQAQQAIVTEAKAERDRLERESASLSQQLDEVQAAAKDELVAATTDVSERLAGAESDRQGLRAERDALKAQLETAVSAQLEYSQRLSVLDREHSESLDQMSLLQDQLVTVEDEKNELECVRSDLKAALEQQLRGKGAGEFDAGPQQQELEDVQNLCTSLRQQLAEMQSGMTALTEERDSLLAQQNKAETGGESAASGKLDLEAALKDAISERDRAETESGDLRAEVEGLRSIVERYAGSIYNPDSPADDVTALNQELNMVREQADRDVSRLREELQTLRAEMAQRHADQGDQPLAVEALRQEVASLREALAERQRELATADLARQRVEDQLEDAAREIERLRRQTGAQGIDAESGEDTAHVEGAKAVTSDDDPAELIEDLLDGGLRDRRVKASRKALDIDKVAGPPRAFSMLSGLLIGLCLIIGGLEAVTFLTGKGELFSFLFGGG